MVELLIIGLLVGGIIGYYIGLKKKPTPMPMFVFPYPIDTKKLNEELKKKKELEFT